MPPSCDMGYYMIIATGLIGPFVMMVYRESLGDLIGEADWMRKVGGVYYVIVFIALFIFFWTLAEVTGTTTILFSPITSILPGVQQQTAPTF